MRGKETSMVPVSAESCNFCGSEKLEFFSVENGYRIVRCRICGLVFVNPLPDGEELKKVYLNYLSSEQAELWGNMHRRNILLEAGSIAGMTANSSPAIFEIGAGFGFFLAEMKKRGWKVDGCDLSPEGVRFAGEKLGIHLRYGDFINLNIPENSYDVVAGFFSLEHMREPAEVLRKANRLLKSGGFLVLRIPNHSFFQIFKFIKPLKLIYPLRYFVEWARTTCSSGSAFNVLDPPVHLYSFKPSTLRKFLEREGFRDIKISCTGMFRRGSVANRLLDKTIEIGGRIIEKVSGERLILSPIIRITARKKIDY